MEQVIGDVGGNVLEIGAGSGANLVYYPQNTSLVTLDLNEHFRSYLEGNYRLWLVVDDVMWHMIGGWWCNVIYVRNRLQTIAYFKRKRLNFRQHYLKNYVILDKTV